MPAILQPAGSAASLVLETETRAYLLFLPLLRSDLWSCMCTVPVLMAMTIGDLLTCIQCRYMCAVDLEMASRLANTIHSFPVENATNATMPPSRHLHAAVQTISRQIWIVFQQNSRTKMQSWSLGAQSDFEGNPNPNPLYPKCRRGSRLSSNREEWCHIISLK